MDFFKNKLFIWAVSHSPLSPILLFFWTQFSQTALCLGHNFLSQVSPITVFNQKMNIAIPFKLEERGMRKFAQSENISHKDGGDTQNPGS